MEATEVSLINYNDVIENIKNQENHLLIGNGFNYGLGISTGYETILNLMIESKYKIYLPFIRE